MVVQVGERALGLDHPELGEVARRVGVFRAEGGAEGVDLRQGEAVALDVELARHRQEGFLAEEIAGEIDRALGIARQVGEVEGGNAEHLPGAFGVRGGDDRRVDPVEAVLVEETVHRLRQAVADAGDGAEEVGARAQVRDFAQELQRVGFGLDRVGFRVFHPAHYLHARGLQLEALALALGGREDARGDHRAAGRELLDVGFVIGEIGRCDDLDRVEARSVAEVHERQARLGVAPGADPAADGDFAAGGDSARQRLLDADH